MNDVEAGRKLKARRRKRLRTSTRKRTAQEETDLLRRFEQLMDQGVGRTVAAKAVKSTLRTIYKLDKQREAIKTEIMAQGPEIGPDISEAIAVLCCNTASDEAFRESLFKYIVWSKWPNNPIYHYSAVTSCVVSYIRMSSGAERLGDLTPKQVEYIFKYLRLDVLSRMCSAEAMEFPSFKIFNIDDHPYTVLDVLAEICGYLMSVHPNTDSVSLKPSVSKAYFLLNEGLFRFQWKISYETFRNFWKRHASSGPFHYIERFHSGLNFDLDPSDDSFRQDVDLLVQQRGEVKQFFARCRWAIEVLRARMDQRALQKLEFPNFPRDLLPEEVRLLPRSDKLKAAIRSYRSASK